MRKQWFRLCYIIVNKNACQLVNSAFLVACHSTCLVLDWAQQRNAHPPRLFPALNPLCSASMDILCLQVETVKQSSVMLSRACWMFHQSNNWSIVYCLQLCILALFACHVIYYMISLTQWGLKKALNSCRSGHVGDAYAHQWTGSQLIQVLACCL